MEVLPNAQKSSEIMKIRIFLLLAAVAAVLGMSPVVVGQSAGDKARIESSNSKGVPVHPSTTDPSLSR